MKTDITEQLDSKLQVVTENITVKIREENERLSQKLYVEIKELSTDICALRNETERKIQEVTTTIGSVSVSLIERIDVHVVVTRKITERVTQETNARAGHLFDDIKAYKTETEDSLKQLGQDYTRHKEQMNSEQANWRDKAGGELDKVKDNVKSVEDRATEIEAAAQNSIQKLNAEITYLRGQIATRQVTGSAMPSQALPVAAVDVEISSQSELEVAAGVGN